MELLLVERQEVQGRGTGLRGRRSAPQWDWEVAAQQQMAKMQDAPAL